MSDTRKTTKPNVPNLRFPGFEGEWENKRIGDIGKFFSGGTPSSSRKDFYGGEIPFIRSGEIHSDKTELFLTQEGYKNSSAKMVEVGDILLALYGANSGDISISQMRGAINQAILCIRTNVAPVFFKSVWEKHAQKILNTYLQGGQGNLSADIVKKITISIPSQIEQAKIAALFSHLDERISIQNRLIDRLQSLIKGIMVKLQQQGLSKGTWKRVPLSSILKERTELNEGLLPVYSVSVSQGVVNQMEYLGRSFAAKDTSKYHVAHFGDLIYTKSPTGSFPYGIVKQNSNRYKVAVSPLYGVYTPANYFTGVFLQEYFKSEVNTFNYLHSLIQKGAKNTINITNQRFLDNYILIPTDSNDLQQISNLLLRLNAKKDLMQNMLQQYQEQKQYLLRQMFI